jgi:hypothetical protein
MESSACPLILFDDQERLKPFVTGEPFRNAAPFPKNFHVMFDRLKS